jgi:hypothetical protein
MSISNDFIDQLINLREIFIKEYYRYRPYLSVPYNKGYNVGPLSNDTNSCRLILVNRGQKKILNCLLLRQTWNIFKNTKNLETLAFSEFAPHTVSNTMTLYSEHVDRYVFAVSVSGICGHKVGDIDYRSDQITLFGWSGTQAFSSYNHSDKPRLILFFDIWK